MAKVVRRCTHEISLDSDELASLDAYLADSAAHLSLDASEDRKQLVKLVDLWLRYAMPDTEEEH